MYENTRALLLKSKTTKEFIDIMTQEKLFGDKDTYTLEEFYSLEPDLIFHFMDMFQAEKTNK